MTTKAAERMSSAVDDMREIVKQAEESVAFYKRGLVSARAHAEAMRECLRDVERIAVKAEPIATESATTAAGAE